MTIIQLEYLLAVANCGSFSLAAEHCFVTPPSLSMQVKALEGLFFSHPAVHFDPEFCRLFQVGFVRTPCADRWHDRVLGRESCRCDGLKASSFQLCFQLQERVFVFPAPVCGDQDCRGAIS